MKCSHCKQNIDFDSPDWSKQQQSHGTRNCPRCDSRFMNKVSLNWLKYNNFIDTGIIIERQDEQNVNFNLDNHNVKKITGVYLWLHAIEGNPRLFNVAYAGKAGRGIANRIKQHKAGHRRKESEDDITKLNKTLNEHGCIHVWFRESENCKMFDTVASNFSFEEEALILKFTPPLNKSSPPRPES